MELTELEKLVARMGEQMGTLAKAMEGAATRVATSNAADLAGQAALEGQPAAKVNRVVDSLDAYGGKGLMFSRIMRASAWAKRNDKRPEEGVKMFGLPEGCLDRLSEANVERHMAETQKRALSESTMGAGGALDPDRYAGEVIEILRAKLSILKAGVPSVAMDGQSFTMPRQATDIVGAWLGEQQDAPATGITADAVQLSLKKYGANVPISNDLLRDAIVAADVLVRDSLVAVSMLALDIAMLRGAGTVFTPRGIRNAVPSASVVNAAAGAGTNTLTTALKDLATLGYLIDSQNVPEVKPALFFNPRYKWGLYQLRDGVGRPFFEDMFDTKMLQGVPFYDTTQIPINLSGGGSGGSLESEIYRIETTQWLLGLGMMPSIETSREASYPDANGTNQSAWTRDETLVRVIMRADIQPRHAGAGAVVIGNTLS